MADDAAGAVARAVARVVSPSFTLPEQTSRQDGQRGAPEKALCAAVLSQAVRELQSPLRGLHANRMRYEARKWLCDRSEGYFTLSAICGWLDLDEDEVRRKVLAGERITFARRRGSND